MRSPVTRCPYSHLAGEQKTKANAKRKDYFKSSKLEYRSHKKQKQIIVSDINFDVKQGEMVC